MYVPFLLHSRSAAYAGRKRFWIVPVHLDRVVEGTFPKCVSNALRSGVIQKSRLRSYALCRFDAALTRCFPCLTIDKFFKRGTTISAMKIQHDQLGHRVLERLNRLPRGSDSVYKLMVLLRLNGSCLRFASSGWFAHGRRRRDRNLGSTLSGADLRHGQTTGPVETHSVVR